MKVLHETLEINLQPTSITLDEENNAWLIELSSGAPGEKLFITTPKIECNTELVLSHKYIHQVLISNYLQENNYCELKFKNETINKVIGFLFPISTLSSHESSLLDSSIPEPIRGHALAAATELLKGDLGQTDFKEVAWGESYPITYFYRYDLAISIYSRDRISEDINEATKITSGLFASFADIKIYELKDNKQPLRPKLASEPFITSSRIHMQSCSAQIGNNSLNFLREHVAQTDAKASEPIVRFFLQYQFFELLMQEVFSRIIKSFLTEAAKPDYQADAWKTKTLVGKLNEKTGEKYRIGRLLGFLSQKFPDETKALNEECTDFLKNINAEEDPNESEPKTYYKVRNAIFHGFGANNIKNEEIESICDATSNIIYKLALHYEDISPFFETRKDESPTTTDNTQ
ncbi:hypothetical protein [Pseudomonas sp. BN606]|uniref:hypothetical protein n=1 Tax=Pseudomonas sp. BN606 TaxID=2567894 RepID=UPI00245781E8|nr:hypothetical protein [Pseudomonas sp. BN606]MDH4651415.1 hypothetical protein [Pseudomonas sp. BN606]